MYIKKLIIYSPQIDLQADFYATIIGLEVVEQSAESVSFAIGQSILTIAYRAQTTPYHFAINIPANKEEEALIWLRQRVEILKDGEHEIQNFDFWNAKAIYFYDEDRNIVELIARKNLDNASNEVFGVNQWLEISEIGVPTSDIEKDFEQLHRLTSIDVFDGGFERFCAIGDENGLFISINKEIKNWFPVNDKAYSSDFQIELKEKGTNYQIEYINEMFRNLVEVEK